MSESKQNEIEECKELLKNPLLRYNERVGLEAYLKDLEKEVLKQGYKFKLNDKTQKFKLKGVC